jgi:hypothetical protein
VLLGTWGFRVLGVWWKFSGSAAVAMHSRFHRSDLFGNSLSFFSFVFSFGYACVVCASHELFVVWIM